MNYFKKIKLYTFHLKDIAIKNAFLIILFAIYMLFHSFFEKIFTTICVEPFFSKLERSIPNDILILLALICIIWIFFRSKRKNRFVSERQTIVSIGVFSIIFYYRLTENIFLFQSSYVITEFRYVDVILLYFALQIILKALHKQHIIEVEANKGFHFDNPIDNPNDDLYKRDNIAQTIADRIKNTINSKTSFAIGISSEWGEGKTSLLNLLEFHLNESKRIIVHFNPWLNNDENTVIASFFDELSNSLSPYNKELSSDLLKYSNLLQSIESDSIKSIKNLITELFEKNKTLRDKFDQINKSIKLSGFQIIIIIDDLDRLYEKEVLEVLRLIRNSASFSNTVFLVAYDRNYLVSAIQKVIDYHADAYLEKIFQVEICLPAFENFIIRDRLKEQIKSILLKTDIQKLDKILENNTIFNNGGFNFESIENLRDLNRLVNSFIISYPSLKGECELNDLMCLEILKMKYLSIYNLLVKQHNRFLCLDSPNVYEDSTLKLVKEKTTKDNKEIESETTRVEEYINDHTEDLGIKKSQINDIMKCIFNIFPQPSQYFYPTVDPLSIRNPISMDRYFHNGLLQSNLSSIEFADFRKKGIHEFCNQIDIWVQKGLQNELLNKFSKTNLFLNKEDYELILHGIFYLGETYNPNSETDACIGFDSKDLSTKLSENNIERFYDIKDELKELLISFFDNAKSPYIAISALIDSIIKDTNNIHDWSFFLPLEFFLEKKIQYFKQYVETIDKIDLNFYWLFNYCSYIEWRLIDNNRYNKKEIILDESYEIVKDNAQRLLRNSLKNLITNEGFPHQKRNYSIAKLVLKVWGDWSKFEEFIQALTEDNISGLEEFKFFYAKFKVAEYTSIEFPFTPEFLQDAILLRD